MPHVVGHLSKRQHQFLVIQAKNPVAALQSWLSHPTSCSPALPYSSSSFLLASPGPPPPALGPYQSPSFSPANLSIFFCTTAGVSRICHRPNTTRLYTCVCLMRNNKQNNQCDVVGIIMSQNKDFYPTD